MKNTKTKIEFIEVQRSINGSNFGTITKVTSAGYSNNNLNYEYLDILGTDPIYFYRLRMLDKDGGLTFSNVIELKY